MGSIFFRRFVLIGFLAVTLAFTVAMLVACSPVAGIKAEVQQVAGAINSQFVAVRQANDVMLQEITAVYRDVGHLDLDPAALASASGGAFKVFGDNVFYYKSRQEGAAYYYCPGGKAPEASALRELRIMGYAENALAKAWQAAPDVMTNVYFLVDSPANIGALYPWLDVVSLLPPGLQLNRFEWYQRGVQSSGASLWCAEPFQDLAVGWAMDVSGPVQRESGQKGVTVINVNMDKLTDKHLGKTAGNLVLLSKAGVVVGASPSAARLLGVVGLKADIVKKTKENKFASADFRLGAGGQTALAKALAQALADGKLEGTIEVDRVSRGWLSMDIPEVGFRLIGFSGS